jgi:hypothetical protein
MIQRYVVAGHGPFYIKDTKLANGPQGKLFNNYWEASALADRLNHWANWN